MPRVSLTYSCSTAHCIPDRSVVRCYCCNPSGLRVDSATKRTVVSSKDRAEVAEAEAKPNLAYRILRPKSGYWSAVLR